MALSAALKPYRSELMEAWEVSTFVNTPENDSEECVRPIAHSQPTNRQLSLL
jgi:putative SOS response-associated peptidase YedK